MARRKDVKTLDPTAHLFGRNDRAAMNSTMSAREKILLGDQVGDETEEFEGRHYFDPARARKLRQATRKALGRTLGGSR